ncbi:unnamed protein product [Ranitomeya imitator]|uniref:Uncharacterized protein n=1 Tax=Ranitomeya imitator TaxID=111125 RepID=A0ABN9LL95_9NEOB|nr:unnamed protein product [Ranitomeya imitator]
MDMDNTAGMSGGEPASACFSYTDEDAIRILSEAGGDNSYLSQPSSEMLKTRWEMERRKLISLELHAGTLVEYFKAKRIPRGLRPNLRPTLMPNNAQFCAKFEAIGNKYAFDIMLLNLEFLKKEIDSLGLKCDETKNALLTATSTDDLGSINSKIEENLLRFRTGLEDTKRSKWFRDLDDYNNGRIYGWQFRNNMPNKSTPGPGRSRGALRSTRKPHKQAAAHTSFGFTGGESDSTDDGGMTNLEPTRFLANATEVVSRGDGVATGVAGNTRKGNQSLATRSKTKKR